GLSPAISIEQKTTSHNPRSTVGTITEIHDYLRLLFARAGTPRCPRHDLPLQAQTISQMVDQVLALPGGSRLMLLAPVVDERKGEHHRLLAELHGQGFVRARIDGELHELDTPPSLDLHRKHTIEVVVDRFRVRPDLALRLSESFETALGLSGGLVRIAWLDPADAPRGAAGELRFSANFACPECGYSLDGLEPRLFSFNNPAGACPDCDGLGSEQFFDPLRVVAHPELSLAGGAVRSWDRRNAYYFQMIRSLGRHYGFDVETPWNALSDEQRQVVLHGSGDQPIEFTYVNERGGRYSKTHPFEGILPNMQRRYRETESNAVREELAKYLSTHPCRACGGTRLNEAARHVFLEKTTLPGITAIPIGRALAYFRELSLPGKRGQIAAKVVREITLRLEFLVNVGLDYLTLERSADHVVDIGPGAGVHGGRVIAQGSAREIAACEHSLTGCYLSGRRAIAVPTRRTPPVPGHELLLRGARANNLKCVDLRLPVGLMCCVTGVSGSGKSSLINDTLYPLAANALNGASHEVAPHDGLAGLEHFDKVVDIDQSPIGRTPRSNPATYTGLFTPIRELFAATHEARSRGYSPGRFSFNVKGGRCEACKGDGVIKVEMHFLPDIYVQCDVCKGRRYNRETLQIRYKGRTIDQVLDMTVEEALDFFDAIPPLKRKLQTLIDVGLAYITLGQNATTLSGGEAQRVKLSRELSKRDTGNTLYILDEPTTGLHFQDVQHLLEVLHRLRDHGNTVVVIEHNLDVIKTADWIVDLGPEGGEFGGEIIAQGTPEAICEVAASHTGRYLRKALRPLRQVD
ncbi:MAG: excinuclease ABC subunit A, partial [Candidatus Sedimenticola endophacoides]